MEALTRPSPPTAAEMPINAKANAKETMRAVPPTHRDLIIGMFLLLLFSCNYSLPSFVSAIWLAHYHFNMR